MRQVNGPYLHNKVFDVTVRSCGGEMSIMSTQVSL